MSRRMSKYVCENCNVSLSTKYALQRHRGTERCLKNQRDNSKDKLMEFKLEPPETSLIDIFNYRPLCDEEIKSVTRSPKKTIFRTLFGGDKVTPFKKIYHHNEFSKEIAITEDNTNGHMLHKLLLTLPVKGVTISVNYNGKNIFTMTTDTFELLGIDLKKIPLSELIFGEAFIPLGSMIVSCWGTDDTCSISYHTYILTKEEAKRRTFPCELFFNRWFETNISNNTDALLLTCKTHAYVADIYYGGDDVNPSFRGEPVEYEQGIKHYNSMPEITFGTKWNLSDILFASLIPPGEKLFIRDTEEPVLVRFVSIMKMDNGKIYTGGGLYGEDSNKTERRLVAERLKLFKTNEYPASDRITTRGNGYHSIDVNQLWDDGEPLNVTVPVQWSDTPDKCEYSVVEPNWNGLICGSVDTGIKEYIESLKKNCIAGSPNFKLIPCHSLGPVAFIDGTYQELENYYCFMVENKWYGISNLDIAMYLEYHVPINQVLWTALQQSIQFQT